MTSAEIKEAMKNDSPVKCNGVEYSRITAYIFRSIKDNHTGKIGFKLQCELLDRCGVSIVIVDAGKVELIK